MKSHLTIAIAAGLTFFSSGFVSAGERTAVHNNRHQIVGTASPADPASVPVVMKKTLVWNNRHQVIGVVLKPSR